TCASLKIQSNAPLRWRPPTNCTSKFRPNAPRRVRPPLRPGEEPSRRLAEIFDCQRESEWKPTFPASNVRCCRVHSTRAEGCKPRQPTCWEFLTAHSAT